MEMLLGFWRGMAGKQFDNLKHDIGCTESNLEVWHQRGDERGGGYFGGRVPNVLY